MIFVKVNKDFLREIEETKIVDENDFYPGETFSCEYVGGDFVRLSNTRREAYISVDFVNVNMTVTSFDETIYGSKLKVTGKVIKNFLKSHSGVNYIVYSDNTRTMYLKEDGLYVVDAKVGYRLDFTEVDVEKPVEKPAFSENFDNTEVKKAVDWAEKKINDFRTFNPEEKKTNDLGLDIMFNTAVSVTKDLFDIGSKKGKELLNKLPSKEELQKMTEEGSQKVTDAVNKTINVVKDKKEQIEKKIKSNEELTLEDLLVMDGKPVWFVVNEDIFPTKGRTGWGIVAVRNGNEILLTTNNATFNVSLNKEFIKLYKNEVIETLSKEEEMKIEETVEEYEKDVLNLDKQDINSVPETAKKELPPLDMDLLIKLQEEFNISFVFAKEALDNSNGDFEEAKKYLNQRLGK